MIKKLRSDELFFFMYGFSAQRTGVIPTLDPALDALSVKVMLFIASEFDDIRVCLIIATPTYATLLFFTQQALQFQLREALQYAHGALLFML